MPNFFLQKFNVIFINIHLIEKIGNCSFWQKKHQFAYNNSKLLFFSVPKLPLTVPKLSLTVPKLPLTVSKLPLMLMAI